MKRRRKNPASLSGCLVFGVGWLKDELDDPLAVAIHVQSDKAVANVNRVVAAYAHQMKIGWNTLSLNLHRALEHLRDTTGEVFILASFDIRGDSYLKAVRDQADANGHRLVAVSTTGWDVDEDEHMLEFSDAAELINASIFSLNDGGFIYEIDRLPSDPATTDEDDEAQDDLDVVNEHRRLLGMRPLDPAAAGWTDEDVRIEARRIRALNPAQYAHELLMAW